MKKPKAKVQPSPTWHEVIAHAILEQKSAGVPLTAIAERAGMPQPGLHRYVATGRGLSATTLERLADSLGIRLAPARSRS